MINARGSSQTKLKYKNVTVVGQILCRNYEIIFSITTLIILRDKNIPNTQKKKKRLNKNHYLHQ